MPQNIKSDILYLISMIYSMQTAHQYPE